jgi:hypothetical protein
MVRLQSVIRISACGFEPPDGAPYSLKFALRPWPCGGSAAKEWCRRDLGSDR